MRKKILIWLFEKTQKIYTKFKRKKAWNISRAQLLAFPTNTFGYELGLFLKKNNFELIPKVERHDAYHVLTGYDTKVEDEIALQYLCFGNGKRSPYLFGVITIGTLLLPDYLDYYYKSFQLGKRCNPFHQFNYLNLLHHSLDELRTVIFNKEELKIVLKNA